VVEEKRKGSCTPLRDGLHAQKTIGPAAFSAWLPKT